MKKRILSVLAALCLCLTLLPTAALAAAAKPWETALGDWTSLNDYYQSSKTLTTGNYYLTDDLLTDNGAGFTVTDNAKVTVDLNGHCFRDDDDNSIKPRFYVSEGGKFTLQDSTGGGYIAGQSVSGVVTVEGNGSFTLKSGMVVSLGGTSAYAVRCKNGGVFTMEGGALYSLITSTATVLLQNGGTFTLNGGSVKASSLSHEGTTYTTNAVMLLYGGNDEGHTENR